MDEPKAAFVPYLRGVTQLRAIGDAYPMSVPVLSALSGFTAVRPVTIFMGENGSGKTTLMEVLACGTGAVRIDGQINGKQPKTEACRKAAGAFRFLFNRRPKHSFYFQAEDFIRYIDSLHAQRDEAADELEIIEKTYQDRSETAREFARMPHAGTLHDIDSLYNGDIAERSHGEGFLDFFGSRLHPEGFYLMDEPEGALSYMNQLALLAMIDEAVSQGCQFILSTHSPVLAAYPGAQIYEIRRGTLHESRYEELDNVVFLRNFLRDRTPIMRKFGFS